MPKYFVGKDLQPDSDTIHHLKRVLRIRAGEEIILCDGNALDYYCIVKSLEPFAIKVKYTKKCETELPCNVTLYQSVPKSDKLEWIIQKTVELGISSIIPVYTEFSIVKTVKVERCQKIAESAAGQSMRGIIPIVYKPIKWKEALETTTALNIAAYEKEKQYTIKTALESLNTKEIALWIGPEGGFSKKEVNDMETAGFQMISLGPRILRTETAAIAALAQINLLYEGF